MQLKWRKFNLSIPGRNKRAQCMDCEHSPETADKITTAMFERRIINDRIWEISAATINQYGN